MSPAILAAEDGDDARGVPVRTCRRCQCTMIRRCVRCTRPRAHSRPAHVLATLERMGAANRLLLAYTLHLSTRDVDRALASLGRQRLAVSLGGGLWSVAGWRVR